jgi:transcriptional regulator GlxA family with amidase domain
VLTVEPAWGMKQAQILLYEGLDELDAVAPFEILAAAGFSVELITLGRTRSIRTSHGMSLQPHAVLAEAPELLVVPGGAWASRAPQGAWAEAQRGVLPAAIAERHAAGSVVAGVCTGVMLLAAGEMLRGRPAVTHRTALDDLREFGADVRPGVRVIDDGDLLTAGGVTAALDLALHLVARECGPEAASIGAARLEYEARGPMLTTSRGTAARPQRPGVRSSGDLPRPEPREQGQ